MKKYKTSEAQRRASKKWDLNNPDIKRKSRAKSGCKSYIEIFANMDELLEVKDMLNKRLKKMELKDGK